MVNLKEIYSDISDSEWRYICRERPELKKISPPTLDTIIVEFLKQYEVYVKPVTSGTRNRGESAMAGAITGIAGADVGGDAFLISGQKKQTAVQEWTQWKQWALNHKDFPAFRDIPNQKANKNNARVDELLATKEVQNDISSLVKKRRKSRKFVYAIYAILLIFVASAFFDKPSPKTALRTLRYSDFIEAVQEKQVSRVLISPDKGTAQIDKLLEVRCSLRTSRTISLDPYLTSDKSRTIG